MTTKPSSNWFALQKSLVRHGHPHKRRKINRDDKTSAFPRNPSPPSPTRYDPDTRNEHVDLETSEVKNGESVAALRRMVLGKVEYRTESQTTPGKYVAIDCEMVGVGIEGNESSLARVSIVNYSGAVILDVFVRQRERVIDYRTKWSGVRSSDLAGSAKPFNEVQQMVAELTKDRILVGHAIYNDLKALLLSHPSPQIRDTQSLAYKHRVVKSRRPALRVLVKQELGIVIQGGEHNSVTDARATMALFRLYKKQWESGFRQSHTLAPPKSKGDVDDDSWGEAVTASQPSPSSHSSVTRGKKRGRSESSNPDDGREDEMTEASSSRTHSPPPPSSTPAHHIPNIPGRQKQSASRSPAPSAQRKGISSGVLTVTSRPGGIKQVRKTGSRTWDEKGGVVQGSSGGRKKMGKVGEKWWKSLGGGKKGSFRL